MIIERKSRIHIPDLSEADGRLFQTPEQDLTAALIRLSKTIQIYNMAMKAVISHLKHLDEDIHEHSKYDLIHHMECRIKTPLSIYRKLQKYELPLTLDAAQAYIYDIAGIRVVCNFVHDIYGIEKRLLALPDVKPLRRRDFIKKPKKNGYRSLHLVISVPVDLGESTKAIPVEVQFRTVAMDYWASLEHMLRYKGSDLKVEAYSEMLLNCADRLAETEATMQFIREQIEID